MVRTKSIGQGPSRSADTSYRGLKGPNGVVFRDADQKKEFRKLDKRGMFLGKTFSWDILDTLGLKGSIESWVEVLKWTELAHIRGDIFSHLVNEFYSSLNVLMDYGDSYPQYTMFFRLRNVDHVLTPGQFGRIIGCDWDGLFNPPNSWSASSTWKIYGDGEYDPHTSKSTKLRSPALRVFHRFITYTLNARKQSNGQVTVRDLLLIDAACQGKKVDTATLLIRKMRDIRTEKGEVALGSLVMFIAQSLGVVITEEDEPGRLKFADVNLLNELSLFKMGIIRKDSRDRWVLVETGEAAEQQQEPSPDMGDEQMEDAPETSAAPAKRSRTEAGSSSYQMEEWQQQIMSMCTQIMGDVQRVHTRMDSMQAQLDRLESYHCFTMSPTPPPPPSASPIDPTPPPPPAPDA